MMVEKFSSTQPSSWAVAGFPPVGYDTVQERLHRGLKYMLDLFPKAARSVLSHLIGKNFPYPDDSKVYSAADDPTRHEERVQVSLTAPREPMWPTLRTC